MTNTIKTATIVAHREARFTQHQWIVGLDDQSEVALPRVFTLPPIGTELELELEPYKLAADVDPHQDERFHVVRIRWEGAVEVHAGEFNALLNEHEVLRANLAHVRGLLEQAEQAPAAANAAAPPPSRLEAIARRIGSAWDVLRGGTPLREERARTEGPFPERFRDAPPWGGEIPTAPPGGRGGGSGRP